MAVNKIKLARFKKELSSMFSNYSHLFKCPVCLNDFDNEKELANAHIIPGSSGGKSKTIACISCDSEIGSFIEGPLNNHFNSIDILSLKRNGKLWGKVNLNNYSKEFKTNIEGKNNRLKITLPQPGSINKLLSSVSDYNKNELNFAFEYYIPKNVNNNLAKLLPLKAAYYAAFEVLVPYKLFSCFFWQKIIWLRYLSRTKLKFQFIWIRV